MLRPHQIEPAARLLGALAKHRAGVDLSDTGVGKTYVASSVANTLNVPTLVICPKIARTAWHRAAESFGTVFSVTNYERIRTGRTPYGTWQHMPCKDKPEPEFFCQSCQCKVDLENFTPCYTHHAGIHCIFAKKTDWNYGEFRYSPRIKLLVFDEAHRCNGLDSLNADLLIAAKRQGIPTLCLSATLATSPLQMRALGYLLGLHTLVPRGGLGFYEWAAKYGCRRDPTIGPGVHWLVSELKQRQIMSEIHTKISDKTVRVRTGDIPGFPERDIQAELYDLEESGKIDELYAQMREPLAELRERSALDVAPESALTKILRERQKVELLKVPIACELAQDYLDKGFSVGIFCDFTGTLRQLAKRLSCDCVIDGSPDGVRNRQRYIDEFQMNKQRLILIQNKAGGICISLQDLDGEHPRVGIVFPTFSIVDMRQDMGRFHRDGGKSKCFYRVIFAANTVETQVYAAWRAKGNNLDALNNLDMIPEKIPIHKR